MSSPGTGLSGTPSSPLTSLVEKKLRAERLVRAGASWFIAVAILSMVNSALSLSGSGIRFIFGLGIAQFIDALAHQAGQAGLGLDLIINGFVAAVFVLFWHFARKAQHWAFLVGMALYAVDALVTLYFRDILAVAFHAYALYRMYSGMSGIARLQQCEAAMIAAGAPIQPQ